MCKRIKAFTQPLGHVGRGLPYQSERRTLHSMFRRGVHHGCSPRGILECGYQWIWLMTKYDLNILYTLKMTLFSMPSRVDCAYGKGPFAGGHVLQCSFHLRLQVWWDVLTQDLSTSHWWPDHQSSPITIHHNTIWQYWTHLWAWTFVSWHELAECQTPLHDASHFNSWLKQLMPCINSAFCWPISISKLHISSFISLVNTLSCSKGQGPVRVIGAQYEWFANAPEDFGDTYKCLKTEEFNSKPDPQKYSNHD